MLLEATPVNSWPPPRVELRSSRIKAGVWVFLFSSPNLVLIPSLSDPHWRVWAILMIALFTLFALLLSCLVIAPYKLSLDESGFTLSGGFSKPGRKVLWQDIDRFCVDSGGRGTEFVGYRFVAGREPPTRIPWLRGKGRLPSGWPASTEDMVGKLNAYRRLALGEEAPESPPLSRG